MAMGRARPPAANVHVYPTFDNLPSNFVAFHNKASRCNFFQSIPWFRTLFETASPSGDEARIYAAESEGRPVASLITRQRRAAGRGKTHMLLSLTHGTYTTRYGPDLDVELGLRGLSEIITVIARSSPPFDVLRFDNLDPSSPEYFALVAALKRAHMLIQHFVNFHNWFEDVQGLSFRDYLLRRSLQLDDSIDRHLSQLWSSGRGQFELIKSHAGLKSALLDYSLVELQCWKQPEPYPECIPKMVTLAAGRGVLRLGLFYIDDEPAAAQIWMVIDSKATLWRSHYALKFDTLAVETALTGEMIRHLLDVENVHEIDFSRDNNDIADKWLRHHRERVGLLVFNQRTLKGLLAAGWHIGGHASKVVMRRIRPASKILDPS
jgi:hypothetical protein